MVEIVLLELLLVLALLDDLKAYRVRNTITLPFILIGAAMNLCINGINSLHTVAIGILIPIICLMPLFSLKMLGAGDIKLFSAIGAIMGHRFVLSSMAFSFLAGGVIALLIMLIRKNLRQRFTYLFQYLIYCFITFSIKPYASIDFVNKDTVTKDISGKFPFAIAVACGTVISLLI